MGLGAKKKFRRRTRFWKIVGSWALFITYSWSKDDKTRYYPSIDINTGECRCTCPWHEHKWQFRKMTLADEAHLCIHLKLAIKQMPSIEVKIATGTSSGITIL